MRHSRTTVPALAAIAMCLAGGTSAQATVLDHGRFSEESSFGPEVITDLPCLEGTAFVGTGSEVVRGQFVERSNGFHVSFREKHEATLVPLDGQGPTYVEQGNTDHGAFSDRSLTGNGLVTMTHVNNDNFVGYEDGKLVGSARIRVHEVEHFVVIDSDGDGQPEDVKVEFTINRVSCP
jgi:hypothetical protein